MAPWEDERVTDEVEPPLCVFCRREAVDPAWRPFCSQRCKLQDLARWADGTYRIPDAQPVAEPEDERET
jgi:endogenous inhibitor of DNA gyrase (YacG/DUF329 family)